MAQINKVRLPNGQIVRPTEWSSTPLYTSVEIAGNGAALTPLQGYSYGLGGIVPGSLNQRRADIVDTNMRGHGGIIQENEELLLYSIMIELFANPADEAAYLSTANPPVPEMAARNVMRIQRDTMVVMKIANTKAYADHPLAFFPAAMGVEQVNGASRNEQNGEAFIAGSNGGINCFDAMEFATPHHVNPGEAYEVTLEFPDGLVTGLDTGTDDDARIFARIYSDGYRRRPVA